MKLTVYRNVKKKKERERGFSHFGYACKAGEPFMIYPVRDYVCLVDRQTQGWIQGMALIYRLKAACTGHILSYRLK